MQGIKWRKNSIKTVIGIYNRTFDFKFLLGD